MRRRARIVDNWLARHVGPIVLILALLGGIQLVYFSYKNRQVTSCQANYNLAVSKAIRERAKYADQDRQSLVTFVREVSAAKSRAESRASLVKYLQTQDEIDVARKQHPIPNLPAGRCS